MEPGDMMNCDDAQDLLAAHALGVLDDADAPKLHRHLRGCADCRQEAAAYRRSADLLVESVVEVEPPAALRSRVLAHVYAEATGASLTASPRRSTWSRVWAAVPRGRGLTLAGLTGTLVASAAAITLAVDRPAPVTTDTHVVSVRTCGLTADPAACGDLTYDSATQTALLSVTGLRPMPASTGGAPSRSVYEVWLVRPDRSVVAASALTPGGGGTTWTAAMQADMSGFAAVAMTLEPDGVGPAPKGPEVLRIALPGAAASTS